MSHTLFLLEGSLVAQELERQCRPSMDAIVHWVDEEQMRKIAWEIGADAPLPRAVREAVAGETGAVFQEWHVITLRRALLALMGEPSARTQHVGVC
jgi:hypothetical protein